ncbi:MAG: NmrA/HSCARG family protein [Calditrichaeota bacterium]|nr:MAG: NmrA/HSCARG family protein [Calditrichota bacterium]
MNDKMILVSGATGKQGGAVARQLLKDGWKVRALTRDASQPAAKELEELGAEIFQGDMTNLNSLEKAMEKVYGVFSVQQFWEDGLDGELEQGKTMANVAKANRIEHFVYTSVSGAEKKTGVPHFDTKWDIEDHIKRIGLSENTTVVRPVFFMENFLVGDWFEGVKNGRLVMAMTPKKPIQLISVEDIGIIVGKIFANPKEFKGKSFDIAGDSKNCKELADAFSKKTGKDVEFVVLPMEQLRSMNEDFALMFEWFNKEGYSVNIKKVKEIHSKVKSFKVWLKTQEF